MGTSKTESVLVRMQTRDGRTVFELSVDHMFTENVEIQGLQLSSFKVL